MSSKNRELSQFSQFLNIDDANSKVGIATTTLPFVGIGTTNPTSKFFVNGNTTITGILTVGAVRGGGGQIGISSSSTYVGLTTNLNFVGVGLTITPQYNPLTGITTVSFTASSGGSPGGSESQIQYYSSGGFAGSPNFTFSGIDVNVVGLITATRFISTATNGTAPLSVASSTIVTNLNVDYLEGYNPQVTNIGNSIVLRDAGGNFQAGIVTAASFIGSLTGAVTNTTGTSRIETLYGTNVYYSTGYFSSGIVTSLTNTNAILTRVNISGIVTVGNNPVLIGVAASTGTQNQKLQVEGKGYFSDNLGIGDTNPSSRLTVVGDGSFSGVVTASSFIGPASYALIAGVSTNVSGGAVNVASLQVSGISTFSQISAGSTTGTSNQVLISTGVGVTWSTLSGAPTVVDDTTTDSTYYPVYSTALVGVLSTATVSSTKLQFNPSTGNLSATVLTSLSDASKKTNITKIENALQIVENLDGVYYEWKENGQKSIGLIAQDVEKVVPELVLPMADGLKTVSYGNIVAILIEAIKEQQVRINILEEKLNAQ